jgi:DNA repair protein RadC
VRETGGVKELSRASPRELAQVMGVGTARATRIAAAFELGRRAIETEQRRELLARPEDVFRIVGPRVAGLQQEVFISIGVDIRNGLLDIVEVARGTVHAVEVHPREVFRPLIRMAAAGGVVVHNHPSGDPTPSREDIELTRRLRAAGDVLGLPIIDHVVIADGGFSSIAEWLGTEL